MKAYLFLIILAAGVLPAKSQEAKVPPQQRAEFEVASVKPSPPSGGVRFIGSHVYPGGRVVIGNAKLELLIQYAFNVQPFQVSGGPAWMRDYQCRYEIEARPPSTSKSSLENLSSPNLSPEQREMLQSLLMDRFQLQFHRETRQGPVYLLTLGKGTPKLTEVKDEGKFEWVGSVAGGGINGDGLAGKNISMPVLALRLSAYLEKPVIDQTGLKGPFDFKFEYAKDEAQPDVISCILTSLQGIGLKLKPSQGPVETIVIDHAEKPSAN